MSIEMNETTLGYALIALGILTGLGLVFGIYLSNRSGSGYTIKLKHIALPIGMIAVGAAFAFGLADRPSRACEPAPGETYCLPGGSATAGSFKAPQPPPADGH
jgi:hypothetical protein